MQSLIIPFRSDNVLINPSLHAEGLPSMNAITGCAHAAIRLISAVTGARIIDHGAALAINSYSRYPGRPKHVISGHGKGVKAGSSAPLSNDKLCTLSGWLVLRFNCSRRDMRVIHNRLPFIEEDLPRLRFSGGSFEVTEPLRMIEEDECGVRGLSALPSTARLILDQTALIADYASQASVDHLKSLTSLLLASERQMADYEGFLSKMGEIEETKSTLTPTEMLMTQYLGHLVAVDIGYRAIENPAWRVNPTPYLHLYAEPVLGLARILPVSSFLSLAKTQDGFDQPEVLITNAYWQHVAAHPYYLSKESVAHAAI